MYEHKAMTMIDWVHDGRRVAAPGPETTKQLASQFFLFRIIAHEILQATLVHFMGYSILEIGVLGKNFCRGLSNSHSRSEPILRNAI